MSLNQGQILWGPDDQEKVRAHIYLGDWPEKKICVLIPIMDYVKCPDKSYPLTADDHPSLTKDSAVHFQMTRVIRTSDLEKFCDRPPPFDLDRMESIRKLLFSDLSTLSQTKLMVLQKVCEN